MSTKVCLVKAIVFPVFMYGCESWTMKKAECQRSDAFKLCCCWRLLRVPWTARRSNQSILKEISLECSLEGLMLKLKLQYFGHLMQRADSLEKTLILWKTEDRRRSGQQNELVEWHHWFNGHKLGQTRGDGEGQGGLDTTFHGMVLPSEQRLISLTRIRRVLSILVQTVYTQIWKKESWKCSVSLASLNQQSCMESRHLLILWKEWNIYRLFPNRLLFLKLSSLWDLQYK